MAEDQGGFAFPSSTSRGLTVRDWFAGQALLGMISRNENTVSADSTMQRLAKRAYATADAMLEARAAG